MDTQSPCQMYDLVLFFITVQPNAGKQCKNKHGLADVEASELLL